MATQKKSALNFVPSILEEYGAMALPYHKPDAPFKTSAARNGAFKALQDAGEKGMTLEEWREAAGAFAGTVGFILKAKRRVRVHRNGDRYYILGPTPEGKEMKVGKSGKPLAIRKKKAKKVEAEEVSE